VKTTFLGAIWIFRNDNGSNMINIISESGQGGSTKFYLLDSICHRSVVARKTKDSSKFL
jgi:hypothetical protein